MGWIAEGKECNQTYYGWYCSSARQQGIEPLSYEEWKTLGFPKKAINEEGVRQLK